MHRSQLRIAALALGVLACTVSTAEAQVPAPSLRRIATEALFQQRGVLVFSKTAGFRHSSIPAGIVRMESLCAEWRRPFLATEDAGQFTDAGLAGYSVVVFLNTTGDVLNDEQQAAFERFMQGGGGFLGVHSAADTEYEWPFYRDCVGAYFRGHPAVQDARIEVLNRRHRSTRHFESTFTRKDEWYDFRAAPLPAFDRLLRLDVESYKGERMVADGVAETHPIAWCREMGAARCLYTGGGHTPESFDEPEFVQHLRGALCWLLEPRPRARF